MDVGVVRPRFQFGDPLWRAYSEEYEKETHRITRRLLRAPTATYTVAGETGLLRASEKKLLKRRRTYSKCQRVKSTG